MRLLEKLLVNNPLYAWLQRREVANLHRLAPLPAGLTIMDLGCGRGVETALIAATFRPGRLVAFDLDRRQVLEAGRRLSHNGVAGAALLMADASRLPFGDERFDAAVEMAVMHHVPDWRAALREVVRVLKPGGSFHFLDISKRRYGIGMKLMGHDMQALFTIDEFQTALEDAGLTLERGIGRPVTPVFDMVGVARKAA
jgi:ubiquinone/menaquinone biosynthesis C-methylase UbiE